MTNKYEVLLIIKSGTTEVARDKSIAKFEKLIEKAGGTIDMIDKWGNRRFAYPIDFKREGFYVLIYFTAPSSVPSELERVLRISDEIVRFMVINRNGMGEPISRKKKETVESSIAEPLVASSAAAQDAQPAELQLPVDEVVDNIEVDNKTEPTAS
jgi:small subunit ribosomal protein S6